MKKNYQMGLFTLGTLISILVSSEAYSQSQGRKMVLNNQVPQYQVPQYQVPQYQPVAGFIAAPNYASQVGTSANSQAVYSQAPVSAGIETTAYPAAGGSNYQVSRSAIPVSYQTGVALPAGPSSVTGVWQTAGRRSQRASGSVDLFCLKNRYAAYCRSKTARVNIAPLPSFTVISSFVGLRQPAFVGLRQPASIVRPAKRPRIRPHFEEVYSDYPDEAEATTQINQNVAYPAVIDSAYGSAAYQSAGSATSK